MSDARFTLVAIIGCVAAIGCQAKAENRDAPRQTRPNVLFIVIDTLRADHLGCYGYGRPTSANIDRLAAQGVLFEQCEAPASWTFPSVMSMFTGLLPVVHGCVEGHEVLSTAIPTLPERFRKKGYFCGAIISNPQLYARFGFGRGFDPYDDYSLFMESDLNTLLGDEDEQMQPVTETVTGAAVTDRALRLLEKARRSGQPWFLFIVYFDPHASYVPPPPYHRKFDRDYRGAIDGRGVQSFQHAPPVGRDLQHLIARYDGEIDYTDQQVGRLLAGLDDASDPSQTLVILVSDHDEAFADHGVLLHGNNAYREEVHVPMIWRWPGVLPAGRRVVGSVSAMDIPATLNEVLKFDDFAPDQGRSLWPAMVGGSRGVQRPIVSQRAFGAEDHVALTDGDMRLHAIFAESPAEVGASFELYELAADPFEQINVLDRHRQRADQIKQSLVGIWSDSIRTHASYQRLGRTGRVKLTGPQERQLEAIGYADGAGDQ